MSKEYNVDIEAFQGPLAVLLALIEQQELDISSVSLGKITEAFLRHIHTVETVAPHDVADFLVVAGRLLYLKSKQLLPELTLDEEEGMDIADQLRLYQQFAEAAEMLADRAMSGHESYGGVRQTIEVPAFSPPPSLTGAMLAESLHGLIDNSRPYVDLPETMMERTVSVEEKIEQLKSRIASSATTYFHDIATRGSRSDVVASFLALLELLKQDILHVEQSNHFGDIAIHRV